MTPEKKLEKQKFQKYININDTFSNEEIKILINMNSEFSALFKSSPNKKHKINSSYNLNENYAANNFSSSLIPKKIFYKIIFGEMQKHFLKEKNNLMSKILSLLIREIIHITKFIEENSILNNFISHLEKRHAKIKKSGLTLSLNDFNLNKTENDIKPHIRTKSQKHYYSPAVLKRKNPENLKLFKGMEKVNNIDRINKQLFDVNENFNENLNKNKNNENGGTEHEISNYNNTLNTINLSSKETDTSFIKNKKIGNKSKKVNNHVAFKDNNKNKKSNKNTNLNSTKNNILYKHKKFIKRKNNINNLFSKIIEKENNINKYTNKSINKRKINFEQINNDDKKSLNLSYNTKKSNNDSENKNIISPNISIVTFLNSNSDILNQIETPNFNIFNLDEKIGKENTLSLIGYYIFNRFGFYNIINYNNFEKWCKKISEGYLRTNPYHTDLHAADITHTCLIYFKIGKVNEICKFNKISKCSLFLSCICHDYKHPGVNNNYLKETKNILSLTYNDNSILENFHISETFKLINSDEEYNIFNKVEINIYKQIRKEMISCVLATDMTFHNFYVDFMKEQININNGNNKNSNNEKENKYYQNYMNLLIHAADISNPTKPFDIYFKWAKLVVNEFYEQGDKEKELGLACSCDRNITDIYKSQLGFINYIEIPFFTFFADLFKKLKFYFDALNDNKNKLIEMQQNENNNKKDESKKV
jgi:hypothetical protein